MAATAPATYFHGGTIWSGTNQAEHTSVLVEDGVITAFDAAAAERADQIDAARVHLDGGFLMPGFNEGHSHPIDGGLEQRGPQIVGLESVEAIVGEVRRYADAHPEDEWILGASYNGSLVDGGLFDARWLDAAVSDRPVVLYAWDYHTLWCNSEALRRAGITRDTPEPVLGEIPRRADGEPLGTLREVGALDLMLKVSPGHPLEERIRALGRAIDMFTSLGITYVHDSLVPLGDVDVYLEAARRGMLRVRMNLAFLADPREFPTGLPALVAARERVRALNHPLLTANTIKFYADGVIENETGSLLEPYCTGHHRGMRVWQPQHLAEAVTAVQAEGFQPYVHAIGDDAVRTALDAMQAAKNVLGELGTRPVVTHVQLAEDSDLARFAELGVIANMQPLWAQQDSLMTVLTVPRLGRERSDRQYRLRTLADSGARVAFGSDWPCSSADPREGIAIAATRTTVDGDPVGGWMPEEILPLESAMDLYTRGTAYQAFADTTEHPWGTLEVGNSADFAVLSRDPRFEAPALFPTNTIRATYLLGRATYVEKSEGYQSGKVPSGFVAE